MNNLLQKLALLLGCLFTTSCIGSAPTPPAVQTTTTTASWTTRPEVKAFIDEMVEEHHFNRAELNALFARSKPQPKIVVLMDKPGESKPWKDYRANFITQKRIDDGVAFWKQHEKLLRAIEKKYQVPAPVIVSIVGVETSYGKQRGNYLVVDALSTLSFDYPRRSAFFKNELKDFLILTREQKLDPLTIYGSYAGAMGPGQFMPSTYRRFAVDYDDKGGCDLFNNMDDALASVANYLKEHGWKYRAPVTVRASVKGTRYSELLNQGTKPFTTVKEARQKGLHPRTSLPAGEQISVLSLSGMDGEEVWLTLPNFYVITRYNKSPMYAMAVFQLSEELRKAKK